jgi:hypothetical protein
MKYAKYIPELQRRETWEELVTRNKEMHKRRYPGLVDDIETIPYKNWIDSYIDYIDGYYNQKYSWPNVWMILNESYSQ